MFSGNEKQERKKENDRRRKNDDNKRMRKENKEKHRIFLISEFGFRMVGSGKNSRGMPQSSRASQALPKTQETQTLSLSITALMKRTLSQTVLMYGTISSVFWPKNSDIDNFDPNYDTRIKTTRQRLLALVDLCSTKMSMRW